MNMDQITSAIAKRSEGKLTKEQARIAYNNLVEVIVDGLNEDVKAEEITVALPKIGKIKVKYKDEYEGFNPRKKEKMTIAPSRRVYFSAFKQLKDRVNEVL